MDLQKEPYMDHDHEARAPLSEATQVAIAYLGNPSTQLSPDEVGAAIHIIYDAVEHRGVIPPAAALQPAVPVEDSIGPDYLICLEDGEKLKMLKRYLRSQFNMSPEDYRAKWGLPADYPMVAPDYSARRSELAKTQGLGRKTAPVLKVRRRA